MPADQTISTAQAYTTLHEWLRRVSDHTIRSFPVARRIAARKNISYNHSGDKCVWPFQFALPETHAYFGGQLNFPESDLYRQFELNPQMFYCADGMDLLAMEQNKGEAALVKRRERIADNIRKAMQQDLNRSIYWDGASHAGYPAGLETFLGAKAGYVVGDRICQPDDTYAGFATDLGTLGGSWDTAGSTPFNTTLGYEWPEGFGTSEYDATSPKLYNVRSTAWTAGTNAVADNLEEVISQATMHLTLTGGDEGKPDICVLSSDYWMIYEAIQRAKAVINVPHRMGQDVGFEGFNQNGVTVLTEFGVPATRGYLLNTSMAELRCWTSQLFVPKGPQDEIRSLATLWATIFIGQWCWQPKHTAKIYPYASS